LRESPETAALVGAVAARLREARRAQGLTLRALSEKTGLSEPFLSKLERGRVSTSIANLILISRTVGIELGQLFQDAAGATATQHYALVRAGERRAPQAVHATGYTIWATPRLPNNFELLLRHDELTPNKDVSSQKHKRDVFGIAYWFPNLNRVTAAMLLDYDALKQPGFTPARADDRRYGLKMLINF